MANLLQTLALVIPDRLARWNKADDGVSVFGDELPGGIPD